MGTRFLLKSGLRWSLLVALASVSSVAAGSYISMGIGDLLLGQPTVQIEVYTPDDPATTGVNERVSFGPEPIFEVIPHTFVLDTGANSLLIARDPYADLLEESNLQQMKAKGFQDAEGRYLEQGVGGFTEYNVSAAYHLDAVAEDQTGVTLPGVRIMSEDTQTLGDYSGIIGMPAMMGMAILLDMTPWIGGDGFTGMANSFLDEVPASDGIRYHIPLTMMSFPQDGQVEPDDPLPAWAPLPFLKVYASGTNHTAAGRFLMDTGAQLSMLSEHLAFQLGLDSNGDAVLDSNDVQYAGSQLIGAVGGEVEIPMFSLEALSVPTAEGVDLRWETSLTLLYDEDTEQFFLTNVPVTVLVIEISPQIDGAIAMDLIHSGWSDAALGGTNVGAIRKVCYDFTNAASGSASMLVDLSPEWNLLVTNAVSDRDGDGIPDAWELVHFGATITSSGGSDQDGDGLSDASEFAAGTDPTNAASQLVVADISPSPPDKLLITWQAATGHIYEVQSTLAGTPAWTTIQSIASGPLPTITTTVSVQEASGLLRVAVEPP